LVQNPPSAAAEHNPDEADVAWYALYTRSHCEKVVQERLTGKGFEAFSPFYTARRRRGNRNADVDAPLFPSYVFCRLNPLHRLPILKTPGVVYIVSRGGQPEAVEPLEIASLHTIMKSGRPLQPWDFLRSGQKVRIRTGCLAGAEGFLLRVESRGRLIVSLTLLQRSVAVEIDQEVVEPLY